MLLILVAVVHNTRTSGSDGGIGLARFAIGIVQPVVSWNEFEQQEPSFAAEVRSRMESGRHRTLATLRADGSPRISGIECEFVDGELRLGSMDGARKLADLRRDPRLAIHSPTVDPVEGDEASWPGEAKIAGRAIALGRIGGDGQPEGEQFAVDIDSVVLTRLDADATRLVVDWWTPRGGRRRVERE